MAGLTDFKEDSGTFLDHTTSGLQDLQHNRERFKPTLQFFDTSRPMDLKEDFSAAIFKIKAGVIIKKYSQGGVIFFDKIGEEIYKLYNEDRFN
jgi:hypothetical protein